MNELQGAPVSNQITYNGAVGNRKLNNGKLETAVYIAMQNVAAGADPAAELKTVQDVADAQ